MMQMVGAFAEFERAMIRERTSAGLAAARAEGRIGGRRKKLDTAKRREMAESVWDRGFGAGPVGDNEVELREELSPTDLALVQLFRCHEGLEVLVVRDDLERLLSSL